jgi:hypothetical protein
MYAGRYEVIGARDVAEIRWKVVEQYMSEEGRQP